MRWLILSFLASTIILPVAVNGQNAPPADQSSAMQTADRNQDGLIDLDEYNRRVAEIFYFVDKDKDGNLTINEIRAMTRKVEPERVNAADTNGDGLISTDEFHIALKKDFDEADEDDDGMLNSHEVKTMLDHQ